MPTAKRPPATITGPKYGIELKTQASSPHIEACFTPITASTIHVLTPTTRL
jgi:hypothetical protein